MAVTITIAGISRSVSPNTLTISHTLFQRSQCDLTIPDPDGDIEVSVGSSVLIKENEYLWFAGTVTDFERVKSIYGAPRYLKVRAVDYSQVCDRRIVQETHTYTLTKLYTVVADLAQRWLTDEDIDTSLINVGNGSDIEEFKVDWEPVSDVFNRLASQFQCSWRIEAELISGTLFKHLRFEPFATGYQAATLTDNSGHIVAGSLQSRETREQYANTVYVRFNNYVADRTYTFEGDNFITEVQLDYEVVSQPTVTIGTPEDPENYYYIRVAADGTEEPDPQWEFYVAYWTQGSKRLYFNKPVEYPLHVEVMYRGKAVDLREYADEDAINARKAAEGGSGIYTKVLSIDKEISPTEADDVARTAVNRFGQLATIVSFETDNIITVPGERIVSTLTGIPQGTYIVRSVTTSLMGADLMRSQLEIVSGNMILDGIEGLGQLAGYISGVSSVPIEKENLSPIKNVTDFDVTASQTQIDGVLKYKLDFSYAVPASTPDAAFEGVQLYFDEEGRRSDYGYKRSTKTEGQTETFTVVMRLPASDTTWDFYVVSRNKHRQNTFDPTNAPKVTVAAQAKPLNIILNVTDFRAGTDDNGTWTTQAYWDDIGSAFHIDWECTAPADLNWSGIAIYLRDGSGAYVQATGVGIPQNGTYIAGRLDLSSQFVPVAGAYQVIAVSYDRDGNRKSDGENPDGVSITVPVPERPSLIDVVVEPPSAPDAVSLAIEQVDNTFGLSVSWTPHSPIGGTTAWDREARYFNDAGCTEPISDWIPLGGVVGAETSSFNGWFPLPLFNCYVQARVRGVNFTNEVSAWTESTGQLLTGGVGNVTDLQVQTYFTEPDENNQRKINIHVNYTPPASGPFVGVHCYLYKGSRTQFHADTSPTDTTPVGGTETTVDLGRKPALDTDKNTNGSYTINFVQSQPRSTQTWYLDVVAYSAEVDAPPNVSTSTVSFVVAPYSGFGMGEEWTPNCTNPVVNVEYSFHDSAWFYKLTGTFVDPNPNYAIDRVTRYAGTKIFKRESDVISEVARVAKGHQSFGSEWFPLRTNAVRVYFCGYDIDGLTNTINDYITPIVDVTLQAPHDLLNVTNFSVEYSYTDPQADGDGFKYLQLTPTFTVQNDPMFAWVQFWTKRGDDPTNRWYEIGNFLSGQPALIEQIPIASSTWNFLAVAIDVNGKNRNRSAVTDPTNPPLGTPTFDLVINPPSVGSAGREYCELVTDVSASRAAVAYSVDGVELYGFVCDATLPNDTRFAGYVPHAKNLDTGDVVPLTGPERGHIDTGSNWPVLVTTNWRIYFVSVSKQGQANTIVDGVTPSVDLVVSPGTGQLNLGRTDTNTIDDSIFGIIDGKLRQLAVDLSLPKTGTYDPKLFQPIDGQFKLKLSNQFTSDNNNLEIESLDCDILRSGNILIGNITGRPAGVFAYKYNPGTGQNDLVAWFGHNGSVIGGWSKEFYIGGTGPGNAKIRADANGNVQIDGNVIIGAVPTALQANAVPATGIGSGNLPSGVVYTGTVIANQIISGGGGFNGITLTLNQSNTITTISNEEFSGVFAGLVTRLSYIPRITAVAPGYIYVTNDAGQIRVSISGGGGGDGFIDAREFRINAAWFVNSNKDASFRNITCSGDIIPMGYVSTMGYVNANQGFRVGGSTILNSSGQFVGAGVNCPGYGVAAAGFNPNISGFQYYGRTVTLYDRDGNQMVFRGGVLCTS